MYIFDHLVDELRRKTSNCIIGHPCFPHNSGYMRQYNTYREDLY